MGIHNLVYAAFLCDHTTGSDIYSFVTDGYGIFNVRTYLGACFIREGGQSQTSLHFGGIVKLTSTLPRQGFEPMVFGFEFCLATSPVSKYRLDIYLILKIKQGTNQPNPSSLNLKQLILKQ